MKKKKRILGWREWLSLPELGISAIKAKVDTGARTSALHAFSVVPFKKGKRDMVRFFIHPFQRTNKPELECVAEIYDQRAVTDSGGHREERYVILTPVKIGETIQPIEITLTNRDTMGFRMLLGRSALQGHYLVNPGKSYYLGKWNGKKIISEIERYD